MPTKEEINQYKPYITNYLKEHGYPFFKAFHCMNPNHPDHHPSMRYDDEHKRCKCFSCGAAYDICDLVQIELGCSFINAFNFVRNKYKSESPVIIPKKIKNTKSISSTSYKKSEPAPAATAPSETTDPDGNLEVSYTSQYEKWAKNLHMTDYLSKRGISIETAQKHQIGYMPEYHIKNKDKKPIGKGAIVIPTSDVSYNVRPACNSIDVYPRYEKKGHVHIFNSKVLLDKSKTVFVTEGELDALSVEEVGFDAVALGGVNFVDTLIEFIRENQVECELVLVLDNDFKGREYTEQLSQKLDDLGINYRIGSFYDDDHPYKDPNEALIKDRAYLKQKLSEYVQKNESDVAHKSDDYLHSISISGHREQHQKYDGKKCIPTGIKSFDDAILGGLRFGTYVMGGIPSCGKSTLAWQIASYIAENGNIVVYVSLEMSEIYLVSKSIARGLEAKRRKKGKKAEERSISATDILFGSENVSVEDRREIKEAEDQFYNQAGENLIILENSIGSNMTSETITHKIEQIVEEVMKKYGREKNIAVFVDYLQIIPTQNSVANDKMAVDSNMAAFQLMANTLKIPVFIISSLGRNSYNKPVTLESFKESGSIEYSADTLIGLQYQGIGDKNFDLNSAKSENPRKVELVLIKQRMGAISDSIQLDYYPACDLFVDPMVSKTDDNIEDDFDDDDDDFLF